MKEMEKGFNRRQFIGSVAAAGTVLMACGGGAPKAAVPKFLDQAPDGKALKAGLIGCGGRGTGAALDFLNAGPNLKITAVADAFPDRIKDFRETLKKDKSMEIADDKCFNGFDAYKEVLKTDVDLVILATPPHFRPEHFKAAIEAKKNVFMEKPVAVDPVGARTIMSAAKQAQTFGLSVVTGTQRRHQRNYLGTFAQIKAGAIGEIRGGAVYWNQSQLWFRNHEKGWSDMEWAIRDWVNWCWLPCDHIVEQHVHNLDVMNWFMGAHPVRALGMGSRQRRVTGDQYDFFDVDYTFENGVHIHSLCRQINGCTNNVSEHLVGTKGYTNCADKIWDLTGKLIWEYPSPKNEKGEPVKELSPYVQEHVDLITSIRTGKPINEAENTATSTLTGIMGRISAYTGKEMTWDEAMNSSLRLGPVEYKLGALDMTPRIPVPGSEKE
jgi:myo-inositol 2-dehydrogenase / D-chiro-inositol 1-dehydrogenase